MELTLIIRSKEELAAAVQALVEGIADGLEAAGASGEGPQVNPPDDIKVRGMLVTGLNADTIEETDTTPANTQTTTEVQAAVTTTTTDITSANTQTTTEVQAAVTTTTTDITSANTQTTTEVQAAVTTTTTDTTSANTQTTTDTTNAQTITVQESVSAFSENTTTQPPNRTTNRAESGGNQTVIQMDHTEY